MDGGTKDGGRNRKRLEKVELENDENRDFANGKGTKSRKDQGRLEGMRGLLKRKKRIKMYCAHAQIPHDECNHYIW